MPKRIVTTSIQKRQYLMNNEFNEQRNELATTKRLYKTTIPKYKLRPCPSP